MLQRFGPSGSAVAASDPCMVPIGYSARSGENAWSSTVLDILQKKADEQRSLPEPTNVREFTPEPVVTLGDAKVLNSSTGAYPEHFAGTCAPHGQVIVYLRPVRCLSDLLQQRRQWLQHKGQGAVAEAPRGLAVLQHFVGQGAARQLEPPVVVTHQQLQQQNVATAAHAAGQERGVRTTCRGRRGWLAPHTQAVHSPRACYPPNSAHVLVSPPPLDALLPATTPGSSPRSHKRWLESFSSQTPARPPPPGQLTPTSQLDGALTPVQAWGGYSSMPHQASTPAFHRGVGSPCTKESAKARGECYNDYCLQHADGQAEPADRHVADLFRDGNCLQQGAEHVQLHGRQATLVRGDNDLQHAVEGVQPHSRQTAQQGELTFRSDSSSEHLGTRTAGDKGDKELQQAAKHREPLSQCSEPRSREAAQARVRERSFALPREAAQAMGRKRDHTLTREAGQAGERDSTARERAQARGRERDFTVTKEAAQMKARESESTSMRGKNNLQLVAEEGEPTKRQGNHLQQASKRAEVPTRQPASARGDNHHHQAGHGRWGDNQASGNQHPKWAAVHVESPSKQAVRVRSDAHLPNHLQQPSEHVEPPSKRGDYTGGDTRLPRHLQEVAEHAEPTGHPHSSTRILHPASLQERLEEALAAMVGIGHWSGEREARRQRDRSRGRENGRLRETSRERETSPRLEGRWRREIPRPGEATKLQLETECGLLAALRKLPGPNVPGAVTTTNPDPARALSRNQPLRAVMPEPSPRVPQPSPAAGGVKRPRESADVVSSPAGHTVARRITPGTTAPAASPFQVPQLSPVAPHNKPGLPTVTTAITPASVHTFPPLEEYFHAVILSASARNPPGPLPDLTPLPPLQNDSWLMTLLSLKCSLRHALDMRDSPQVLFVLRVLYHMSPSRVLMRATQIIPLLKSLYQHESILVSRVAKRVVKRWRRLAGGMQDHFGVLLLG